MNTTLPTAPATSNPPAVNSLLRPHQGGVQLRGFLAMVPPATATTTETTARAVSARAASLEVVQGGGGPFVKSKEHPVLAAPKNPIATVIRTIDPRMPTLLFSV